MSRSLEIWTNLVTLDRGNAHAFVERAKMLEADGWDGATLPDSHSLNVEAYVTLTAAALATKRLRFSTGVTNPSTRHPAVTAAAMLTLHMLSDERMVIGIGRGDASLAYLGGSPVGLAAFESSLEMLDTYMRGRTVPIEVAASALARNSKQGFGDDLAMNHAPEGSLLKWVTEAHSRPPIDVFASGPKVIEIAARRGDYITFALGADVARLKWAIDIAKAELQRIGRDPADVSFGAHIPTYPHRDVQVSRKLAEGYITAQARFGVMTNKVVGPATEQQRANLERLASNYDMQSHGSAGSAQARVLDDSFFDAFGVLGDPEPAVSRLQEIVELGFDRLQLVTSEAVSDQGRESYRLVTDILMPALRAACQR